MKLSQICVPAAALATAGALTLTAGIMLSSTSLPTTAQATHVGSDLPSVSETATPTPIATPVQIPVQPEPTPVATMPDLVGLQLGTPSQTCAYRFTLAEDGSCVNPGFFLAAHSVIWPCVIWSGLPDTGYTVPTWVDDQICILPDGLHYSDATNTEGH